MFKTLVERYSSWKQARKILPIEVFMRHCHYSTVSAHKERFTHFTQERCLHNFLSTIDQEKKLNVTFFLDTFHPMESEHFLRKQTRFPIIEFNAGSEAVSFLHMLEHVYNKNFSDDTLIYFLEDDYLHLPNWPTILREAFTLPNVHYATLFDHRDKYTFPEYKELKSTIYHTQSCHWRTIPSTTNTYAMQFGTLKKHIDWHRCFSLGRDITADHAKFCKLHEEGAILVSSIPGYSTHAEPEFASPCTDWEALLLSGRGT